MIKNIPHFHAIIGSYRAGVTCGLAIINSEESWIIREEKTDKSVWYEAIHCGSLYSIASYTRIQEVFWNSDIGEFVS